MTEPRHPGIRVRFRARLSRLPGAPCRPVKDHSLGLLVRHAATGSGGESRPSRSGAAALLARPGLGQGRHPKQAIRLIMPWPPGGSRVALLGRQIDMVADAQAWRPQVAKGDFRLLSVWTRTRLPSFPETPPLNGLGYGMTVTSPYGFAGPKGLPPESVETLHASFRKAMLDEASQAIMRRWELPDEISARGTTRPSRGSRWSTSGRWWRGSG